MNIRSYITFKKTGNQREPNPSLQRGSPAVKPLRFSKKVLTKGYINNSINFESIFLEND